MSARDSIVFEAYGVTGEVVGGPEGLEELLPPGWRPGAPEHVSQRFVDDGNRPALEAAIRAHVALNAPEHVFVHAGVAAIDGRAIVVPGSSFSGKTTLVAELVRAGGTYFSDEFAVLDAAGRVHPYAKPLSVRDGGFEQVDFPVGHFGGTASDVAAPVDVIAVTWYLPDAAWEPVTRQPADGALALLSHTVPARTRPAQALAAVRGAAEGATVLEGVRGDAAATARALLELLRARGPA